MRVNKKFKLNTKESNQCALKKEWGGMNVAFKFFAENHDIPKGLLLGEKIIGVKYMKDMTILSLSNGCEFYIHHDTGETNLIEIEGYKTTCSADNEKECT